MSTLAFVDAIPAAIQKVRRAGAFCVTDENVFSLYQSVLPSDALVLPAGEGTKRLATVDFVCEALRRAHVERGGVLAAIGGGVVSDTVGFCAAVYMRGIRYMSVPTTLLAQVDAAIGGKTAVDSGAYKNLIGAFKMPQEVVICPSFLRTLSAREWRCGLGEIVKTMLLDRKLYNAIDLPRVAARDESAVRTAVELCARFKENLTASDPLEAGKRVVLNLGHTVGHALEACENAADSHGEYVLAGLRIEAAMTDSPALDKIEKLLKDVPPRPFDASAEDVTQAAFADKKNAGGKICVLKLCDVGKAEKTFMDAETFAAAYRKAVQA